MAAPNLDDARAAQWELIRRWRAWSLAVTAAPRSDGSEVAEARYRGLHGDVLQAIARCREVGGDSQVWERADALARPWVSLEACRGAAPKIHRDLLRRCLRCETEIVSGAVEEKPPRRFSARPLIFAAGLAAVMTLLALWLVDSEHAWTIVRVRLWSVGLWITRGPLVERIAAGSAAMFGVGWWMLHSLRPN